MFALIEDWLKFLLGSIASCPAEETFLCSLLKVESIGCTGEDSGVEFIEGILAQRQSSIEKLLKWLEDFVDIQKKTKGLQPAYHSFR